MSEINNREDISLVQDFSIATSTIYKYLISKWRLISIIVIFSFCLGYIYQTFKKPIYRAELTFASENENSSSISSYLGLASQLGFDLGSSQSGAFTGNSLMAMLKSRILLQKTFLSDVNIDGKNILLINYLIKSGGYDKNWKTKKGLAELNFSKDWIPGNRAVDSVFNKIIKEYSEKLLSVDKKDKSIDIVTISFNHSNEFFAKIFVEQLVKNAIDYYVDYKSSKSKKNVAIIEKQIDSVKNLLGINLSYVASTNDLNINPIKQVVRVGVDNRRIDLQANTLVYGELLKNYELAQINLRREIPFIQIIDTPILPLENQRLSKATIGLIFSILIFLIVSILFSFKAIKLSKIN